MSDVLLIIHILAAAAWFGANMVQFFMASRMGTADTATAAVWQRSIVALGTRLYAPAAIVALVSGFGLVGTSDGAYAYSDPFVAVGIVMVAIGAVLGVRFFGPQAEKAAAAYDSDDRSGGDAIVGRVGKVGAIDSVLLIATVAAMVMKWGV